MPASVISDHELRQRLEEHSYNVPPITDTTRKILLKKLNQLDDQKKSSQATNATKKGGYSGLDYSSADDEDFPAPVANSTRVAVRQGGQVRPAANGKSAGNSSSTLGRGRGRLDRSSRTGGQNGASTSTNSNSRNSNTVSRRQQHLPLISNSETEEGSEEEEEVGEEEEEEEESEEEEDVNGGDRVDFGIQTSLLDSPLASPGLVSPSTSSSHPYSPHSTHSYSQHQPRFRGQRLANNSQANSFNGNHSGAPPISQNSSIGPSPHSPNYPMLTPYLRKNLGAHGSLGEAISTLPPSSSSKASKGAAHHPQPQSSPTPSPLTQAKLSHSYSRLDTSASAAKSKLISSCIMVLAVGFFIFLGYQYLSLVPARKSNLKIPICGGIAGEIPHHSCIPSHQLNHSVSLYKPLVNLLPTPSTQDCHSGGSVIIPLKQVEEQLAKQFETLDHLPNLLLNLVLLLKQNPDWGIRVSEESDQGVGGTNLEVVSKPMSFFCWGLNIVWWVLDLLTGIAGLILTAVLVILAGWMLYLGWGRWSAAKEAERQEVFQMVDQVASLLSQHNDMARSSGTAPFVAVDHIRDQIIHPRERTAKKEIWAQVQQYISKHESRVREDLQRVRGEDFRVWQWVAELKAGPLSLPSSPGDRSLRTPVNTFNNTKSPMNPSQTPHPNHTSNESVQQWPHVPVTHSISGPPGWQGGAFQHSKHVAAPPSPPTSCLKVRHMFEVAKMQQVKGWEATVKSEIVRRCNNAQILHIAVDSKSEEGTVYIKTKSTTDAGLVFSCLHGQWYRGQLVTAKYLKLERYHERFPDSRSCTSAMRG